MYIILMMTLKCDAPCLQTLNPSISLQNCARHDEVNLQLPFGLSSIAFTSQLDLPCRQFEIGLLTI